MRVLYVIPGLGGGGGAERSLAALAPYWRGRLEVHVVSFSERVELIPHLEQAGVTVTNLGPQRGYVTLVRELRGLIARTDPDLVHSTLFKADVATRLAGLAGSRPLSASLVNTNYGPEQWSAPGQRRWKYESARLADAVTAQRVARFHALSTEVKTVMSRRLHLDPGRIEVISRGRDRATLGTYAPERRVAARERLGVGDRPLIIAAARHEWQKGLDVLIRAAPAILAGRPDAVIRIGGPAGSQTPHLTRLAGEVGLDPDETFLGRRSDVPDLMCAADAFCVPSRWEGLGSIMVEAMGLGAPVVASDVPPIRELDPQGSWVRFCSPGEAGSLAQAVLGVLGQTGEEKMERHERAVAQFDFGHDAEAIADRMAAFFERAATGEAGSG